MTQVETLGSRIRAARLGYGWLNRYRCYLRVSEVGDLFRFDVAPPDAVPSKKTPSGQHRVWWGKSSDPDLGSALADVVGRVMAGEARLRRVRAPVSFFVDDAGVFRGVAA